MANNANARSSRPFDLLVYGATGFTGKKVAKHIKEKHPSLNLAIAGRSKEKLDNVAADLGLPATSVVVAPVDNADLLHQAMKQARIVLACAGPYRHVGIEIVKAAIEAQTDYLDICGEPQFFDDVLVQHESAARASNTLVVSACAFDCVPAELSATFVTSELRRKHQCQVTGIEVVHSFEGIACGNPTTFHAAVDGFHAATTGELHASRQAVKSKFQIPKPPARAADWPEQPQTPGTLPEFHDATNLYTLKFMGADAAAILASQRYLRLRNPSLNTTPQPRLAVCFGLEHKSSAYKVLGYGSIFALLARYQWGCNLLRDNPERFSGGFFREGGPTDAELAQGRFVTHSFAYGPNNQKVRAICKGPEPGYVATPQILAALAITVLRHRNKLPFQGGVMLPGALFGECPEAYELLRENGIAFDVETETADPVSSNA